MVSRLRRKTTTEYAPVGPSRRHQGCNFSNGWPRIVALGDGAAQIWNSETGKRIGQSIAFPGVPAAFAIRPDGKAVIVGGEGKEKPGLAQVWSLEEKGDRLSPPLHHALPLIEVAFDRGGTAVRTRDSRHTRYRWEIATGQPMGVWPRSEQSRLVALSPTGNRHVEIGTDGRLRLYIGGNRAFVALAVPPMAEWQSARFSDDGETLITGWSDGVRLWDAATSIAIGPLLSFPKLADATFVPGQSVLAWNDTETRLWRLPKPSEKTADEWRIVDHSNRFRAIEGRKHSLDRRRNLGDSPNGDGSKESERAAETVKSGIGSPKSIAQVPLLASPFQFMLTRKNPMFAKMFGIAAAFLLIASLSNAAEKPVKGKIKTYDAEKKTLVVTTGKKGMTEDKEYKVSDELKLTVVDGDDKKELAGKDALKAEQLKQGAKVELTLDGDKVTAVTITMKKKKT